MVVNILKKYYGNQEITLEEAVMLIEEYMRQHDIVKPNFISNLISHPASQMLMQKAIAYSAEYLTQIYTITRVFSKEGNLLMVY